MFTFFQGELIYSHTLGNLINSLRVYVLPSNISPQEIVFLKGLYVVTLEG